MCAILLTDSKHSKSGHVKERLGECIYMYLYMYMYMYVCVFSFTLHVCVCMHVCVCVCVRVRAGPAPTTSDHPPSGPHKITDKLFGNTRYFVMKSNNFENIEIAKDKVGYN